MSQNDDIWSARVPSVVKDYLQNKKKLSAGRCLCEYYKILKSQELPEKIIELEKARKHVLQLEADVIQLKSECNTQWADCNTIFEQLALQPSFDINNLDERDKGRIISRLEKKGIRSITADQFIEHYQNRDSREGSK